MADAQHDDTTGAEALLGNDSDVVETLVANHRRFLDYLERRVGDRATAEDILHDAFLRGMDSAKTLRDNESAVAWFYRVLRNAVIDHHRRRGVAEKALERIAVHLSDEAPPPELENEICHCVSVLAGTLKDEYARAIRRVEVDGLSVEAFAKEAGITPNNAAVRLFRARQALRKRVIASCGTCATHGCLDCTCEGAGGCG